MKKNVRSQIHFQTNIRKAIALLTCAVFTASNMQSADCSIAISQTIPAEQQVIIPNVSTPIAGELVLPGDLGRLDGRYVGKEFGGVTVIHIQDAHSSIEAQKKIAAILNYVAEQYGEMDIFLEGVMTDIRPNRLAYFNEARLNDAMVERMLKGSLIGGVELFLWQAAKQQGLVPQTYGIENKEWYRENIKLFGSIQAQKNLSENYLRGLKERLLTSGSTVMRPALKKFFREYVIYEDTSEDMMRHVATLEQWAGDVLRIDLRDAESQMDWPQLMRLTRLKALEKKIDAGKAGLEAEALMHWIRKEQIGDSGLMAILEEIKAGRRKAVEPRNVLERFYAAAKSKGFVFKSYEHLSRMLGGMVLESELDATSLFKEIESLTGKILDRLAETNQEKQVVKIFGKYLKLRKLLNLEVIRSEYEEIATDRQGFQPGTLMKEAGGTTGPTEAQAEALYEEALSFYKIALRREESMYSRMTDVLRQSHKKVAVLVTGGFHSEGLRQRMREGRLSYAQVMPKITDLSAQNDYMKLMTADRAERSQVNHPSGMEPAFVTAALGIAMMNPTVTFAEDVLMTAGYPISTATLETSVNPTTLAEHGVTWSVSGDHLKAVLSGHVPDQVMPEVVSAVALGDLTGNAASLAPVPEESRLEMRKAKTRFAKSGLLSSRKRRQHTFEALEPRQMLAFTPPTSNLPMLSVSPSLAEVDQLEDQLAGVATHFNVTGQTVNVAALRRIADDTMSYFLSSTIVPDESGLARTAYRPNNPNIHHWSNPGEWAYDLNALMLYRDAGGISEAEYLRRVGRTLDTLKVLQNDPEQSYHGQFYAYYYVFDEATGTTPLPATAPNILGRVHHDWNREIPSADNALLTIALLTLEQHALTKGHAEIARLAGEIARKMDYSIYITPQGNFAHTFDLNINEWGKYAGEDRYKVWDLIGQETGAVFWAAYANDSIHGAQLQKALDQVVFSDASYRSSDGKSIVAGPVSWDGSSFAYFVSLMYLDPEKTRFATSTVIPSQVAQLVAGKDKGLSQVARVGFSDIMAGVDLGGSTFEGGAPPNLKEEPWQPPLYISPYSLFLPLNLEVGANHPYGDVTQELMNINYALAEQLRGTANYQVDATHFGYYSAVPTAGGVIDADKQIFGTLDQGFIVLSTLNYLAHVEGRPNLSDYLDMNTQVAYAGEVINQYMNQRRPDIYWEGETDYDVREGSAAAVYRDGASRSYALHVENEGQVSYTVTGMNAIPNAQINVHYSDDIGNSVVAFSLDGNVLPAGSIVTDRTAGWNSYSVSANVPLGDLSPGQHTFTFSVNGLDQLGVDIDSFSVFTGSDFQVNTVDNFEGTGPQTVATYWDADGATVYQRSLTSSVSHTGTTSMEVQYDKNNLSYSYFGFVPVQDGIANDWSDKAGFSFWVKADQNMNIVVKIEAEGLTREVEFYVDGTLGWQQKFFDFAPTGPERFGAVRRVYVFADPGNASSSGIFHLDDMALVPQSAGFVSKLSPDGRWLVMSSQNEPNKLWVIDKLEDKPLAIVAPGNLHDFSLSEKGIYMIREGEYPLSFVSFNTLQKQSSGGQAVSVPIFISGAGSSEAMSFSMVHGEPFLIVNGRTIKVRDLHPADINDSGHVIPLHALLVINLLNALGPLNLPSPDDPNASRDVNNDNAVTALDALVLINYMNAKVRLLAMGFGEGEADEILQNVFLVSGTPSSLWVNDVTTNDATSRRLNSGAVDASMIHDKTGDLIGITSPERNIPAGILAKPRPDLFQENADKIFETIGELDEMALRVEMRKMVDLEIQARQGVGFDIVADVATEVAEDTLPLNHSIRAPHARGRTA
jgi:hypothetical protein